MKKIKNWQLKQRQKLPLKTKILMSKRRIRDWYRHWHGKVYISFSGGKDSTVLLHLVRSIYPNCPAVFVKTGLQYPEIREFVKVKNNITQIRPEKTFRWIIKNCGYPIITKMQAGYIDDYRNGSEYMKKLRWVGKDYGYGKQYKIHDKWKYLVNAPFKISKKCCYYMKKKPFRKYNKETGRKAYVGIMATDSSQRKKQYLQHACNAYKLEKSRPIAFWRTQDIWDYIRKYNLRYSSIYDKYEGMVKSTGCIFCMFGVHLESNPNRFHVLRKTHPKLYNYCIKELGIGKVLDYIGVDYRKRQLMFSDYTQNVTEASESLLK